MSVKICTSHKGVLGNAISVSFQFITRFIPLYTLVEECSIHMLDFLLLITEGYVVGKNRRLTRVGNF